MLNCIVLWSKDSTNRRFLPHRTTQTDGRPLPPSSRSCCSGRKEARRRRSSWPASDMRTPKNTAVHTETREDTVKRCGTWPPLVVKWLKFLILFLLCVGASDSPAELQADRRPGWNWWVEGIQTPVHLPAGWSGSVCQTLPPLPRRRSSEACGCLRPSPLGQVQSPTLCSNLTRKQRCPE